ncbi:sirohydrochlorin cobaltochelatase [Desulfothermus naphthae]
MRFLKIFLAAMILSTLILSRGFAMEHQKNKIGIVVAAFGTTYPEALRSLLNIRNAIKKEFPTAKVKMAFTSNIIRNIWHKRQTDPEWINREDIPKDIFYVKGPLAAIAELQDEGYRTIIVQPTHFYAGEEFMDLCSYVDGLTAIKTIKKKYIPFEKLVVGRPLTGMWGVNHDYNEDINETAKALKKDVEYAKKKHAALVYMGHGNEYFSTGVYAQLQNTMRRMYKVPVFIGTVEGFPSLDDVISALIHSKVKRVVLKPLMMVAGDHANNDMAGPEKDSWKSIMESKGIKVYPILEGLGENPEIVKIFVEHVKDAAKDNGIHLH